MEFLKKILDCARGISEEETNKYTLLVTNYYFYNIEPEFPDNLGEAGSMFLLAKMVIDNKNLSDTKEKSNTNKMIDLSLKGIQKHLQDISFDVEEIVATKDIDELVNSRLSVILLAINGVKERIATIGEYSKETNEG